MTTQLPSARHPQEVETNAALQLVPELRELDHTQICALCYVALAVKALPLYNLLRKLTP